MAQGTKSLSSAATTVLLCASILIHAAAATGAIVNSLGMTLMPVSPGSFVQGYSVTPLPVNLTRSLGSRIFGDFDESPYQPVNVSYSYYVSATEVTNYQYEQYDPSHAKMRGYMGFSKGDNESVVFVSWFDAVNFTKWLSAKEGVSYRLPTEAEWEYACRAGTTTYFNTGDNFPYGKNQVVTWYPGRPTDHDIVNLTVANFPPNAWGLYDMHGNVEEWTSDWWQFYDGRADSQNGLYRVTRGGSHSTELYYLRSANRMAAIPQDSSWYIGFRVVRDTGNTAACPSQVVAPRSVAAQPPAATKVQPLTASNSSTPMFMRPLKYVQVTNTNRPPFTQHNHDPALAVCPNGDVVATWFTTIEEPGRESAIAIARFPAGSTEWPRASMYSHTPDRMENAANMWYDPKTNILHHFHGVSAAATWGNLAVEMRTSTDCGITWSTPQFILPDHGLSHQPVNTAFRALDGSILLPCDNTTRGSGGTTVHLSYDNGQTWTPDVSDGHDILGIHGTIVQLKDGTLQAFGRGNDIDGMMAMSLSTNMAKSWTYQASAFPGIHGGQRGIQLRLEEGPIMFCSFASNPMPIPTECGESRNVTGLYCALSIDEGLTWYRRRLVSDDGPGTVLEALDGNLFIMGFSTAEPDGYSTARQGPDGTIHLISSRQHYRFNLAWLQQLAPCQPQTVHHSEL